MYGYCTSNDQCHGSLYDCVNNKCQCKQDYTSVSADQCTASAFNLFDEHKFISFYYSLINLIYLFKYFFTAHLLYSCTYDSECSDPWHSHCSYHGKCVCRSNNIAVNRATCLPILNGSCWRDDQCTIENSICIDFRCVCELNFIAVAKNLCISINSSIPQQ